MKLNKASNAGTGDKGDILINLEPLSSVENVIELTSSVEKKFGEQIKKVINEMLVQYDLTNTKVIANDRGALDYAIRARVETAIVRASGKENICE